MIGRMRHPAALALLLVLLAGCSQAAYVPRGGSPAAPAASTDPGVPYPAGCAAHGMTMRRCDVVIALAASDKGIDPKSAAQVLLLADPTRDQGCGPGPSGIVVICHREVSLGSGVRFVMPDGSVSDVLNWCGVGSLSDIRCTDSPEIRVSGALDGYFDIPEGATPAPTVEPAERALAVPLSVSVLDIRLDHLGPYRIEAGRAVLANGILQQGTIAVADPRPTDLVLDPFGVSMRVERIDGAPLGGAYDPGWQPGPLEVRVVIEFNVLAYDPGAVLRLRDVLVG